MRVWGKRISIVAIVAVTLEPILVIFAWAMYGAVGLAIAVLVLTVTVAIAFWSLQSQYDALELAIMGVRDESDYSLKVKEGLRRLRGVK